MRVGKGGSTRQIRKERAARGTSYLDEKSREREQTENLISGSLRTRTFPPFLLTRLTVGSVSAINSRHDVRVTICLERGSTAATGENTFLLQCPELTPHPAHA